MTETNILYKEDEISSFLYKSDKKYEEDKEESGGEPKRSFIYVF